jgi:hypothetical protein
MAGFYIDCFSGSVADLKRGKRTADNALMVLAKDPMVSCFDRSYYRWVDVLICDLEKQGFIVDDNTMSYPWQRFEITEDGRAKLEELNGVGRDRTIQN